MVAHSSNPSTGEAQTIRSLGLKDQPGLHTEFQANMTRALDPVSKNKPGMLANTYNPNTVSEIGGDQPRL